MRQKLFQVIRLTRSKEFWEGWCPDKKSLHFEGEKKSLKDRFGTIIPGLEVSKKFALDSYLKNSP